MNNNHKIYQHRAIAERIAMILKLDLTGKRRAISDNGKIWVRYDEDKAEMGTGRLKLSFSSKFGWSARVDSAFITPREYKLIELLDPSRKCPITFAFRNTSQHREHWMSSAGTIKQVCTLEEAKAFIRK